MRPGKKCGAFSMACFFAPAGYLFCAYVSIYCTFADRWSHRLVYPSDDTTSVLQKERVVVVEGSEKRRTEHLIVVVEEVTGVHDISNASLSFRTIASYSTDTPINDVYVRHMISTPVTFYFGLFHVCRHDIGRCFIYSFEETSHLKALFIGATYILLVISICPIVVHQLRLSIKSANVIKIPLLVAHTTVIIIVLSSYARFCRTHNHTTSWTFHITASLAAMPWIVWYWHTIQIAGQRRRALQAESSTSVITTRGVSGAQTRPFRGQPLRQPHLAEMKPPTYQEVLANQHLFPVLVTSDVGNSASLSIPHPHTPPPQYKIIYPQPFDVSATSDNSVEINEHAC